MFRKIVIVGAPLVALASLLLLVWTPRSLDQIEEEMYRPTFSPSFVPEQDTPVVHALELPGWASSYTEVSVVFRIDGEAPSSREPVPIQFEVRQVTRASEPHSVFEAKALSPGVVRSSRRPYQQSHKVGLVQGSDPMELEFTLREAPLPPAFTSCCFQVRSVPDGHVLEEVALVRVLAKLFFGFIIALAVAAFLAAVISRSTFRFLR